MNFQPVRIIVTREPSEREKFRECLVGANAKATANCQAYVTFFADISITYYRFYYIIDPTQSIKMFEDMMHRSTAPQGAIDYAVSTGKLFHNFV